MICIANIMKKTATKFIVNFTLEFPVLPVGLFVNSFPSLLFWAADNIFERLEAD